MATTVISAPTKTRSSRVQIVDYYRFAAALIVLAGHYFVTGFATATVQSIGAVPAIAEVAKYGYLGVDLFFLISGYVITQSAWGKSAREFAVGRAVRLYPAFWVGMILTASITAVWGAPNLFVSPPQVLANLTMAPGVFDQLPVDSVYWTLLLELKFYALVGVLILFNQAKRLNAIMPVWAIVMAVMTFVVPSIAGRTDFLGNFYLLFAAGAIMAAVRADGWTTVRAVGLASAFAASIPFEITRADGIADKLNLSLNPAVIVTTLVIFFALMLITALPRISSLNLPGSAMVGALTYPVYLIHAHIGYILLERFATEDNKWWVYAAIVAGVLVAAYGIHRLVERGLRGFWFRIFDGSVGRLTGKAQGLVSRRS
ncbi:acyltransferase family protein [Pseudarthrobacter sp. NPDC055928]|uniref:acyltransferase family protein n=1 Tax=Pseudarthrobacter sp. NPDC055928 TaxID=3345661 RepID=UPI0035DA3CAE